MALTVIAVALSVLATIAVGCVLFGLVMFFGRDRSVSAPSFDEIHARDDALAQNIADRLAPKVAHHVALASADRAYRHSEFR